MARSRIHSRGPAQPFWTLPAYRQAFFFILKAAVILEVGTWVLTPVLKNNWFGDDTIYLTMNPLLQDPNRLWKAWFQPGSFIEYYPLEETVQWLQFQLWGLDSPFPYLVCNLVLQLTSALLLWHVLAKLGLRFAWLGGLLFAIHPVLVDSVGVSNELKNTLSLPPFLLAISFYLDFENRRETRPWRLALLMFVVAMLCKITMIFFPIVILLYAWWKRGRLTWDDAKAALPFFVVSLVLGATSLHAGAIYAANTHYQSPGPIHLGGLLDRIALAGLSLAFYFGHCFLPLPLIPYYPLWSLEPLTPSMFLPWLAIALAAAVCYRKRESWGRPLLFALAFFVLVLAPFLGFQEVSYMCLLWVADHFLYIPIIGLIGLVVAGLEGIARELPKNLLPPAVALLVLVLALLALQARSYATLFANQEELWRTNLVYNPDMWFVRFLYAGELAKRDDNDGAIAQLRESLRQNPAFDNAHFALGIDLCKTGDFASAIESFRDCLRVNPRFGAAHLYLGIAMTRSGRLDDAIDQFGQFIRIAPNSADGHVALAQALAKSGRIPEAIAETETAAQLDPDNTAIQQQLEALKQSAQSGPGTTKGPSKF